MLAKNGPVRLDDIAKAFDPNANPDVLQGAKSDQDVYMEFMNLWDTQVKDSVVSEDEFTAFHQQISCLFESDQAFEVYMKTSFKVE